MIRVIAYGLSLIMGFSGCASSGRYSERYRPSKKVIEIKSGGTAIRLWDRGNEKHVDELLVHQGSVVSAGPRSNFDDLLTSYASGDSDVAVQARLDSAESWETAGSISAGVMLVGLILTLVYSVGEEGSKGRLNGLIGSIAAATGGLTFGLFALERSSNLRREAIDIREKRRHLSADSMAHVAIGANF